MGSKGPLPSRLESLGRGPDRWKPGWGCWVCSFSPSTSGRSRLAGRLATSRWLILRGYKVSATPVRYVLFRLLPVLLVSFFISTLVVRSNGRVTLAVLVLVGGHIVLSSGHGLLALLRDSSSFARKIQALLHMVVSGLVIGAGVAGGVLALVPELRNLVPRVDEVSSAMWTAALAAVGGAAIIRATQAQQIDLAELVRESRGSLGSHLWKMTEQAAAEANADPVLIKAILVVENLQRPSWFRRLERFKGRLIKRGTYGVMQVRAQHPLTDEESIRIAVRSFLADTAPSLAADDGYDSFAADSYSIQPQFHFRGISTEGLLQAP